MISKVKVAALALLGIMAADTTWAQSSKSQKKVSAHNSRNSLDWAGAYSSGLVGLNLFDDNSYYYKNGNLYTSGSFKWAPNGNTITLLGTGEQYKIQEGSLKNTANGIEFFKNGAAVGAEDENKTKVVKIDSRLLGGKWMLIELSGKAIKVDENAGKKPYIGFNQKEGTFHGTGGCNGFGGTVEAMDAFKVKFGDAISTMMACLGGDVMATESGLHNVLRTADNYTVKDGVLSLNKARMAPLARFKFVAD